MARRPLPRFFPVVFVLLVVAVAAWLSLRRTRWDDASSPPPPFSAALAHAAAGRADEALASAREALRRFRAPAWEPRMRVFAAVALEERGDAAGVVEVVRRVAPKGSPLRSLEALLLGRALLSLDRPEDAARAARAASEDAGPARRRDAVALAERALRAAGRHREAAEALDGLGTETASVAAARALADGGDREAAATRLESLLLDADTVEGVESALDARIDLGTDRVAEAERFDRARVAAAAERLIEAGGPDTALRLLRETRGPDWNGALPPGEALLEAWALSTSGRTDGVAERLERASTGGGAAADGAIYLRARLDLRKGRYRSWRAGLRRAAARDGNSPWKARALLDLARMAEGRPSTRALVAYRKYREAAGPVADGIALWREAWIAHELGRDHEAEAGIRRVLAGRDVHGSARVAALYWSGRRLERTGREREAEEAYRSVLAEFRNHYYGALAAERLGETAAAIPDGEAPPAPAPEDRGAAGALEEARALRSIGLHEMAFDAYADACTAEADRRGPIAIEAAQHALAIDRREDAARFARTAIGDRDAVAPESIPAPVWRLVLPLPEDVGLAEASRRSGLPPDLLAAVALQESGWRPDAVSSAGARGLLQLMPPTGAELARSLGVRPYDEGRLFEPRLNLLLGSAHLGRLLTRFDSLPQALAAYNAGATRAERWQIPGGDDESFVERIPLPETRSYVKHVYAHRRLYRLAWPQQAFSRRD